MLLPDKNQHEGDQPDLLSSSQISCSEEMGDRAAGKGRGSSGERSPAPFCSSFQQSQGLSTAYF